MYRVISLAPKRVMVRKPYKTMRGALALAQTLTTWHVLDDDGTVVARSEHHDLTPARAGFTEFRSAPAEVVYHGSRIEAEDRRDQALAGVTQGMVGSTRAPGIGVGRAFGPTHRRRTQALARVRANATGAPTVHITHAPRPRPESSALDTMRRCEITDLRIITCAHCLGQED